MSYKIQLRRGTASQWTAANPVLADGEVGIESDTLKVKVGNGSTAWTSLAYNLLGDVADDAVTTAKILNGAVTEAKIANSAVTNDKIANNAVTQAKLASNLSGITVCTSGTRPGSPFEGQIIYETDTDLVRAYDGTAWQLVGASSYAVASGGTTSSITAGGVNYKLHTFTTSGTLTISTAGFVDIMAIGAGGGSTGGPYSTHTSGGGGGGEIYLSERFYMLSGTYAITIGAGVNGGEGGRTHMVSNAYGFGILAAQGGGVGSYTSGGNSMGGGGGGGGTYGGAYGGGTTTYGRGPSRSGGAASGDQAGAGGGGGAGGNGSNGSGNNGGNGGAGVDISSFLGQSAGTTLRAGGGGGGGRPGVGASGTPGSGANAANTGGGGTPVGQASSTGYSGIFYVRSAP